MGEVPTMLQCISKVIVVFIKQAEPKDSEPKVVNNVFTYLKFTFTDNASIPPDLIKPKQIWSQIMVRSSSYVTCLY